MRPQLRRHDRHQLRAVRPDPGAGAIVDELRSLDWASRGTRRAERTFAGAEERLTQQLGRHPSAGEIATEVGADGAEMLRTRERVQRAAVLSLNAIVGDNDVDLATGLVSPEPSQEERLLGEERSGTLHAAVEALPERLRIVVQGYFLGERPMAEIARELGVSESRISQMRAQALELLREAMTRDPRRATPETPDRGTGRPGARRRRRPPPRGVLRARRRTGRYVGPPRRGARVSDGALRRHSPARPGPRTRRTSRRSRERSRSVPHRPGFRFTRLPRPKTSARRRT